MTAVKISTTLFWQIYLGIVVAQLPASQFSENIIKRNKSANSDGPRDAVTHIALYMYKHLDAE